MGMQIKKFQAPTLQKALEQIRAELGDGAIILQADPIKQGILGRHGVEVTAAIDRKDLAPRFEVKLEEDQPERTNNIKKKTSKNWKGLFAKPAAKELQPKKSQAEAVKNFAKEAASQTAPLPTGGSTTPSMGQIYAMKTFVEPLKKEIEQLKTNINQAKTKPTERAPSAAFLESEIQSLKQTLQTYIHEQRLKDVPWTEGVKKLESFWRDRGMSNTQIAHFFSRLNSHREGFDTSDLQSELRNKVQAANSLKAQSKRIRILVGPTGVGKTTTIAKIAAFEKLKLNRKVALVTLDDYKIGGTDQLGHYARILEVPFVKCRSDISVEEQIQALDCDTVFIDTFGTSPKDDSKIAKLRKAIQFRDPILRERQELHLVLPVGISSGDVDTYVQSFSRMNPHYLLFTKWDETENWGGMLAAILTSDRPVSFVGHGQEVPDDISVFDSNNFIETVTTLEN